MEQRVILAGTLFRPLVISRRNPRKIQHIDNCKARLSKRGIAHFIQTLKLSLK